MYLTSLSLVATAAKHQSLCEVCRLEICAVHISASLQSVPARLPLTAVSAQTQQTAGRLSRRAAHPHLPAHAADGSNFTLMEQSRTLNGRAAPLSHGSGAGGRLLVPTSRQWKTARESAVTCGRIGGYSRQNRRLLVAAESAVTRGRIGGYSRRNRRLLEAESAHNVA